MIVIDASVLIATVTDDERSGAAEAVVSRGGLLAPHLIDAEVGHSVRRLAAAGVITPEVGGRFLADLAAIPFKRSPHTFLLETAWGMRSKLSFYDALYLALAKLLEIPVVTFDRSLARAGAELEVESELLT